MQNVFDVQKVFLLTDHPLSNIITNSRQKLQQPTKMSNHSPNSLPKSPTTHQIADRFFWWVILWVILLLVGTLVGDSVVGWNFGWLLSGSTHLTCHVIISNTTTATSKAADYLERKEQYYQVSTQCC
jgi:hypothetical protein